MKIIECWVSIFFIKLRYFIKRKYNIVYVLSMIFVDFCILDIIIKNFQLGQFVKFFILCICILSLKMCVVLLLKLQFLGGYEICLKYFFWDFFIKYLFYISVKYIVFFRFGFGVINLVQILCICSFMFYLYVYNDVCLFVVFVGMGRIRDFESLFFVLGLCDILFWK